MLEARTGPKIMEVNSSPGFEGLERATGKDIARLLRGARGGAGPFAAGRARARLRARV